jgi:hypothetical protein
LSVAFAVWFAATEPAFAQSPPTITIAPTLKFEAPSETPLEISVGPIAALPRGSLLRLHGLPPLAALSAGYSIAPGAWAVPLATLPNLKIVLPGAVNGRSLIKASIVSSDGAVLAEAQSTLVVVPRATPPKVATPVESPSTAPPPSARGQLAPRAVPLQSAPPPKSLSVEERERALRLVKRGDEQLAEGGIAQARLLYERAAEAGLAQGAMALAATYDPDELARLGVVGIQPDRATAARWYERARALGATEAAQRLQRLGAR